MSSSPQCQKLKNQHSEWQSSMLKNSQTDILHTVEIWVPILNVRETHKPTFLQEDKDHECQSSPENPHSQGRLLRPSRSISLLTCRIGKVVHCLNPHITHRCSHRWQRRCSSFYHRCLSSCLACCSNSHLVGCGRSPSESSSCHCVHEDTPWGRCCNSARFIAK